MLTLTIRFLCDLNSLWYLPRLSLVLIETITPRTELFLFEDRYLTYLLNVRKIYLKIDLYSYQNYGIIII